jgi:hypothetical protein
MNAFSRVAVSLGLAGMMGVCRAQSTTDPINKFLVDITPGTVSASDIIGSTGSAIQTIQTSQDFVAVLKPATTGDSKSGYGISITPARTDFASLAMAQKRYIGADGDPNVGNRLLGALTFSFATNSNTISSATYRAYGVAINTSLYLDKAEDPIVIGNAAFVKCPSAHTRELEADNAKLMGMKTDPKADTVEEAVARTAVLTDIKRLALLQSAEVTACVTADVKEKSPWNASRISFSFGAGYLRQQDGKTNYNLGQSFSVNGQFHLGKNDAFTATYRHTEHTLDMTTVPTAPVYARTNLVGLRATYGSQGSTTTQVLAEVSNATKNSTAGYSGAFLYALGLDKKVHEGIWIEFRLGRNRSVSSGTMQNTALLSLKLSPGPTLFGMSN